MPVHNLEMLLFLSPIILSLVFSTLFGLTMKKRHGEVKRAIIESLDVNFGIMFIASFTWFFAVSGGLSQIVGLTIYGISFIVIFALNVFLLKYKR